MASPIFFINFARIDISKERMISVENLTVEFGVRPLFESVSFVVNDHDRIALVGKNGAGKSTMLKILGGFSAPLQEL